MPSVALQNLGCSKNQIDGERLLQVFSAAGYDITTDFAMADTIVVNTCAFIREAQEEAIEAILEKIPLRKEGRCTRLMVSGCFSERFGDEARRRVPEVDLWLGVHDAEATLKETLRSTEVSPFQRVLPEPVTTQYLKIAEGCSHGCSYCVIPKIRGRFTSRPATEIVAEAQWLEERGVRELILVAQDSSFYGRDTKSSLGSLLEKLLAATAFPWIRVMYLHPRFVDMPLLRLFAKESRLCSYFDIPLQHAADPVLRAMNRSPLSFRNRELLEKIRQTVPGAALRTTFITGFPGETETHFKTLVRFVEEMRFDRLGVFPWSPEEGTKAVTLRPRPTGATARRRAETLMLVQREISRELCAEKVGSTQEVIVDGPSDDRRYPLAGRTRLDAPEVDGTVFIADKNVKPGGFVNLQITSAGDYDLYAEEGSSGEKAARCPRRCD